MKLHIKNKVCIRFKMVVNEELTKLGIHYKSVELGEADIIYDISPEEHELIKSALLKSGLELMDDNKGVLIEKIKCVIIELVRYSKEP